MQIFLETYTQTSKTELLKIVEDQREVGGAASRLISYEVIVYLMKSGLEEYRISNNEALLKEVIVHGENFLQCNSALHQYFDCLRYLMDKISASDADVVSSSLAGCTSEPVI